MHTIVYLTVKFFLQPLVPLTDNMAVLPDTIARWGTGRTTVAPCVRDRLPWSTPSTVVEGMSSSSTTEAGCRRYVSTSSRSRGRSWRRKASLRMIAVRAIDLRYWFIS